MICGLCHSGGHLEEFDFGSLGKAWICTSCYNNPLLREQIRGNFRRLYDLLFDRREEAEPKIRALARQYKLPDPLIS